MSEEAGSSSKVINQVYNLCVLDWPTRVLKWLTKEFYRHSDKELLITKFCIENGNLMFSFPQYFR